MNTQIHEYMKYVRKVLSRINYRDWNLVATRRHGHAFLHVEFMAEDPTQTERCEPALQRGRKFLLGAFEDPISADAIIGTAYLAIKVAEDHERDEFFKVDGIALNNPHIKTRARQEAFFHTFPMQGTKGTLAK